MPLDSIKKRILSDSEQEVERIRSEADSESHRIISEARGKAKEIEKQAQAEADSEAMRLERENRAGLEIQSNSILLEAKGEAVEKAAQGVVREVKSILSGEYMPQLLKSATKQFEAASGERFIVRTKKKNSKIVESLKLTPRYDETQEGFALESHDGKMRLIVSPDSIIENESDEIRKEISTLLFAKGERHAEKPKKMHKKAAKAPKKKAPRKNKRKR